MRISLIYVAILGLVLTGCMNHGQIASIMDPRQGSASLPNPDFTRGSAFYFSGPGQIDTIDATRLCKRKGGSVESVGAVATSGDIWIALFTSGIYTPRTAYVYCTFGGPK